MLGQVCGPLCAEWFGYDVAGLQRGLASGLFGLSRWRKEAV